MRAWLWAAVVVGVLGASGWAGMKLVRRAARIPPSGEMQRVLHLERLAAGEPTAANYRLLANAYLGLGLYAEASGAFEEAAGVYRRKRDLNAAYANQARADRYRTAVAPFFHRRATVENVARHDTGAKHEPIYGCYVGAFIDHEDSIKGTYRDEYGIWRRDVTAFNHLVGSKHAIFFMYLGYGRKFPAKFVRHMNDNGAAPQIAWEPQRLSDVRDDRYLRGWARQAGKSRIPIFLRFASEMNGDWTPYHGDPELYKEKFRLVARVMREEAPNVAMVWCPFEIPQRLIKTYYPGDDAVDWVGVNIYSVLYYNNDPNKPADWRNPSDQLRYVYEEFSPRKPIMVCEYAASHMSSLDMKLQTDFARNKIGQMYACLPRLYPRIKAVCWLSMNAVKHAMPGRQKNNYALLDDDAVRKRYEQMLYSEYFLNAVPRQGRAMGGEEILPLNGGEVLRGKVGLSAWVKTFIDRPTVAWSVQGVERLRSDRAGPYKWTLDTRELADGPCTIELTVADAAGEVIGIASREVVIDNRASATDGLR